MVKHSTEVRECMHAGTWLLKRFYRFLHITCWCNKCDCTWCKQHRCLISATDYDQHKQLNLPSMPSHKQYSPTIGMIPIITDCKTHELQIWMVHQQNECVCLGALGSVWELSDQNLRVLESQRLLEWWSGLQVHLGELAKNVCGHRRSHDILRSAREGRQQAWVHQQWAWVHLGAPVTSLGAPTASLRPLPTSLGGPMTALGMPATRLGASRLTVEQSGNNLSFGNAAGVPGYHSYYLFFNDF